MVSLDEQYSMEESNNFLLIKIENKIIDDIFFSKLLNVLNSKHRIGLDFENVDTINSKLFIKFLSRKKVSFFNAKSEILAYLSVVCKKKFPNLYLNVQDFKNQKYKFIKRDFKLA